MFNSLGILELERYSFSLFDEVATVVIKRAR
jgi:hypothetical protein